MHRQIVALFASMCLASQAGELYREFVRLVDTNQPTAAIRSALLIDTNNTASKLTNSVVDLNSMRLSGGVAGVQLGMTMEEVAHALGRPPAVCSRCFGGPRFFYDDVSIIFSPASNSVMTVLLSSERLPQLAAGLSRASTPGEFERVLGKAQGRQEDADFDRVDLLYTSGGARLRLRFYGDHWAFLTLDAVPPASQQP